MFQLQDRTLVFLGGDTYIHESRPSVMEFIIHPTTPPSSRSIPAPGKRGSRYFRDRVCAALSRLIVSTSVGESGGATGAIGANAANASTGGDATARILVGGTATAADDGIQHDGGSRTHCFFNVFSCIGTLQWGQVIRSRLYHRSGQEKL